MRWCLILILSGTCAHAVKSDRAQVEAFVRDYISKVARGETASIAIDDSFKYRLDEDSDEFSPCGKSGCHPNFRVTVNPLDEVDDEDATTTDTNEELFEVQMDVVKGGQTIARRSGCYLIAKRAEKLVMHDYKHECAE